MREVLVGGYVYKEETLSLPDEFDAIYDRFMELDKKGLSEMTFEEHDNLAWQMWEEVYNEYYPKDFDALLVLESEDGDNTIWED